MRVPFTGKFLLMLRAVKRALKIDKENGELHANVVDFALTCKWFCQTVTCRSLDVLNESIVIILGFCCLQVQILLVCENTN